MNYYFYKSGAGNCFLPYLAGYTDGEKQAGLENISLPGLYVGFEDIDPNDDIDCNDDNDHKKKKTIYGRLKDGGDPVLNQGGEKSRDDDHIAHIFHMNNREQVRLIAFDKRHLVIMEIPKDTEGLIIWRREDPKYKTMQKLINGHPNLIDRYKDYLENAAQDTANLPKAVKFLKVIVKKVIPRDQLYLSVDSLSVFRYLNQGTCRPIKSIGATDKYGYADLHVLLDTLVEPGEKPFGAFMRLYLDGVIGKLNDEFRKIIANKEKAASLILATLNPILFETLAFYLCLDLDLIPEAANGKGLDVIDVRARAKTEESVAIAITRLNQLGVKLHEKLEKSMNANHSLSIQCKAYSGDNAQGHDFLMLRRGNSESRDENVLFANDLLKILETAGEFTFTKLFLDSQIETLRASLGI